MRMIDADALLKHLHKDPLYPLIEKYNIDGVIDNAPTIDAEPVVRCKDCRHFKECIIDFMGDTIELHSCSYINHVTNKDDYCSRGERSEP